MPQLFTSVNEIYRRLLGSLKPIVPKVDTNKMHKQIHIGCVLYLLCATRAGVMAKTDAHFIGSDVRTHLGGPDGALNVPGQV